MIYLLRDSSQRAGDLLSLPYPEGGQPRKYSSTTPPRSWPPATAPSRAGPPPRRASPPADHSNGPCSGRPPGRLAPGPAAVAPGWHRGQSLQRLWPWWPACIASGPGGPRWPGPCVQGAATPPRRPPEEGLPCVSPTESAPSCRPPPCGMMRHEPTDTPRRAGGSLPAQPRRSRPVQQSHLALPGQPPHQRPQRPKGASKGERRCGDSASPLGL